MLSSFCDEQVRLGSMSTKNVRQELTQKIIPSCYDGLVQEANDNNANDIPTYEEILQLFNLKSVCYCLLMAA